MFDFETTLLALTAAINAGLFAFVYLGNRHSRVNRSFAFFVLCLSVWALLHIGFRLVASDVIASDLLKASYLCALLIAVSFYYFSIVFPEGEPPGTLHFAALAIVALLCGLTLLAPGFLCAVLHEPYGRAVALQVRDYLAFATLFIAFFLGGQIRLWVKYHSARGTVRAQLLAIAMSVTVIGFVGIFFDLILPSPFFEDFQFVWSGPVLTSIFAIATTYAIFRYRLFNLKAAIVEVLVFSWWLIILVRALSANSSVDFIADQALLALSVPIGTLLLRSLHIERLGR